MEEENNQALSETESDLTQSADKVVRLKKYGCGQRVSTLVSLLGWYGLTLSLGGLCVSLYLVMAPWISHLNCWRNKNCNFLYIIGVLLWLSSLIWFIFSFNLMNKNKAQHTDKVKHLVKIACSVVASAQLVIALLALAYFVATFSDNMEKQLIENILSLVGSLSLSIFSGLLLYGAQCRKNKLVHAGLIYNLFAQFFLILNFSINISSISSIEKSYFSVIGLIVTIIHVSYGNGIIILHFNALLEDVGFYKENLQFVNRAFRIQA